MDITIRRNEDKRVNMIATDEGFFVDVEFSGDHLKSLQSKAEEQGINLFQLLKNEVLCAVTRTEEMILGR